MSQRGGRGGGRGSSSSSSSNKSAAKALLKRSAAEAGLDDRHLKVLSDITRPPLYPDFAWHSAGQYWDPTAAAAPVPGGGRSSSVGDAPRSQTAEAPAAAPVMANHSNGNGGKRHLSAALLHLVSAQRALTARMQAGPHFVRPAAASDVVRYHRRQHHSQYRRFLAPDARVAASLGRSRKLAADARYLPAELLLCATTVSPPTAVVAAATTTAATAPALRAAPLVLHARRAATDDTASTTTATAAAVVKLEALASRESRSASVSAEIAAAAAAEDDDEDRQQEQLEGALPDEDDVEEGADYTANYYNTDDDEGNDSDDGEPTF